METEVRQTFNSKTGQWAIHAHTPFDVSGIEVSADLDLPVQPSLLRNGYTNSQLKVEGSRMLLDLLERHALSQIHVIYFLDSFLSMSRSITFVLEKEASQVEGGKEWYKKHTKALESDSDAKLFVKLRNHAEKQGSLRPFSTFEATQKHYINGSVTMSPPTPIIELPGGTRREILPVARAYLSRLEEIVDDGLKKGMLGKPPEHSVMLGLKLLRERPDGSWVPFALPNGEPKPEEFPSRGAYDKWRRMRLGQQRAGILGPQPPKRSEK